MDLDADADLAHPSPEPPAADSAELSVAAAGGPPAPDSEWSQASSSKPPAADSAELPGAGGFAEDRPESGLLAASAEASSLHWCGPEDGPMPERRVFGRTWIPDLARIHVDRWAEVLLALPERLRVEAALTGGVHGRGVDAFELAISLPPTPSDQARAALEGGPSIPVPRADPPGRGIGRQVNVRLAHSDHESLQVAAKLLGAKPTTIARMLILNGVRRVLAEHDAAIAAARTAVR